MNAKNVATVSKAITYVLLLLAIVGIIGFFAFFTNGFTDDFKSFYLEQNGEKILTSNYQTSFIPGKEYRFDVKYIFSDMAGDEPLDYSIKVVPNATKETSFEYYVNGEPYQFVNLDDLTTAFNISKKQDHFIINIAEGYNVEQVISYFYKDSEVTFPEGFDNTLHYFKLQVSSYNQKITYNIIFNLGEAVSDIIVDPDHVVFPDTEEQPEPDEYIPSAEARKFREYIEGACTTSGFNALASILTNAQKCYDSLSDSEKSNLYVSSAYQAMTELSNALKNGIVSQENYDKAQEYLNQYKEE